jgi:AmmeMemoRadiSam system protein A
MNQIQPADQRLLIDIARRSIETAVCGGRFARGHGKASSRAIWDDDAATLPAALLEPSAAFVTLREEGDLRGCIGLLRFDTPLWENVRDAAAAAALDDPRFYSVTVEELPLLDLEISVLEPPVAITEPSQFQAGRHGIVIEKGTRRGLLLPQVAPEMGWGEREMLEGVCRKANLPPDAWRDREAHLYVFEATCFGVPAEPSAEEAPGAPAHP